ncbi:MAG: Gfo/Idh/MocA family oxidoreductase [Armatimonadetes bacterium]|nr:Gfo/Idh/MocA family oxidoreductase [Armatimonadota bacterium]
MHGSAGLNVCVVGLGFGGAFPDIYRAHPDVGAVGICDANPARLVEYGERHGFEHRFGRLDDVIADERWDAVHLVTPIPLHAAQSVAALRAGKHCACTVPAATSLDDLNGIVAAERETGRVYMMMETAVYTYHFLHAQAMRDGGELGRIQFLRGAHYQDMEGWPPYWAGLPPMHYATHAVAPLLALAGARATRVHCFGSGVMREELLAPYGNPFPIETAIFQLDTQRHCERNGAVPPPASCGLAAEVTRSLFHTARDYVESFSVLGEDASMEWHIENEVPVVFRLEPRQAGGWGRPCSIERVVPPPRNDLLPPELHRFTRHSVLMDETNLHGSVLHGGAHHGSHPHLVHEFVRAIVEGRPSAIDAVTAADWTAPGICAHVSAMAGGEGVDVPGFGAPGTPLRATVRSSDHKTLRNT